MTKKTLVRREGTDQRRGDRAVAWRSEGRRRAGGRAGGRGLCGERGRGRRDQWVVLLVDQWVVLVVLLVDRWVLLSAGQWGSLGKRLVYS